LNDKKFLKKVDKHKKIYNVKLTAQNNIFIETIIDYYNKNVRKQDISYKILHHFFTNSIINGLHTSECSKYYFIFHDYMVRNDETIVNYDDMRMTIVQLNNIYYDFDYLKEYIPWFIEFKNDGYYIVNRNYKYIGTNNISNPQTDIPMTIYDDKTYGKRIWINGGYDYLSNNYFTNNYFTNIINITKNKYCLNECERTNELFALLKMPKLKLISYLF